MLVPTTPGAARGWDALRRQVRPGQVALFPVGPQRAAARLTGDRRVPPECEVCRGAVSAGFSRCYQCARHAATGPGLLADAVVPISYAVKGTAFGAALWRYKSWPVPDAGARELLQALLLVFLRDHGPCVRRSAGMTAPTHLAVVPTGYGRTGPHPLLTLSAPYLRLPLAPLVIRPGTQGRDLDPARFAAGPAVSGARVLLLDDTWVSGASAQSAAAALKLAGARHVAVVVLGRHLDPADPRSRPLATRLTPGPYSPVKCAVHQ
jgi:hypothetical protein